MAFKSPKETASIPMETTKKERFIDAINFLLTQKVLRNKAELMDILGIPSSGNLSQLMNIKYSRRLTEEQESKFLSNFESINPEWYYTGKGSMLKEAAEEAATEGLVNLRVVHPSEADGVTTPRIVDDGEPVGRPYYDVDFMGGFGEFIDSPSIYPSYYIDYKPFNREGVFWVNVVGDSMSPELRSGDAVALRPIVRWYEFLFYDKIYAVVTQDGQRTIKRIRRSSERECFRLVPINPEYDEQDIPKGVIRAVFEVLGGIKNLG